MPWLYKRSRMISEARALSLSSGIDSGRYWDG